MNHHDRICAEIDLGAILRNVQRMHAMTKEGCGVIPVVKADGYGHGSVEIAAILEKEPYVIRFAVATAEEAYVLRENGITKPIMLLGISFGDEMEDLVRMRIGVTVSSFAQAKQLSDAAVRLGEDAEVFIAVDTGMHRIGFRPCESSAEEIGELFKLPHLVPGGIFSHFARADEFDLSHAKEQFVKMTRMIALLEERGVVFPLRTMSNSAGILTMPEANLDAIRAGIMMYGLMPSDETAEMMRERNIVLEPAMRLVSHIVFLKEIEKGDAVSYGGTYVADGTRRVATIPVGYADGYPRGLSGKASVLIRGQRAPILGRICMDQFMADVTEIPDVCEGDEVTLLGRDGEEEITAEELGAISGRFNYELVCGISKRVPRTYRK